MNISIHSNLLCFGRIQGGLEGLYGAIRDVIGKKATIIVPAYTLNIPAETPFNPRTTKPQSMGSFSDYFFSRQNVVRTVTPLHSHFIDGPLKKMLLASDHHVSMGPGSIFEVMQDADFSLLLLGCSFQEGASFIHHIEACRGVCYREWVSLKRIVTHSDNKNREFNLKYYARKRDSRLKTNLEVIQDEILRLKLCTRVPFNFCSSYLMNLAELKDTVGKIMDVNPTILMEVEDGS